jgi:quinol monooxygenase YgiN
MIVVQGHMQLSEGSIARLKSALVVHIAAVRAFDGCELYSLAADTEKTDLLWVSERWRDKAAQALHMASDHMVRFNLTMQRARILEAQINAYDGDMTVERLIRV